MSRCGAISTLTTMAIGSTAVGLYITARPAPKGIPGYNLAFMQPHTYAYVGRDYAQLSSRHDSGLTPSNQPVSEGHVRVRWNDLNVDCYHRDQRGQESRWNRTLS